ncbi:MAG: hypothetical protein HYY16_18145, partial [Planctomycetes bacterium]|nr:hypothetical protein [Planctomycetota bacterium]
MGLSKLRLPALAVLAATLAGTGECGSPVKLIYAKALQRAVYLDAFGWMEGHIEVENRGFEKDVVVRYREMQTEEWHDVAATYAGPIRGTFERWTFRTPEVQFSARLAATFRFAIRYRVNGQEYWDNNSGSDYVVGVGPRPLGPEVNLGTADVVLKKADLWPAQENGVSRLSGEIILRNLGFQKSVKVEATPDDGDTILNVDATYGHPYGDDTEIWYVQGDIPSPAGHRLQCWVRYTVNAQTYLDTNFGANYELRTVPMLMELTIASGDSTVPVEIPGGVTGPTVRFKGRGADNVPGH